jgi:hypothetical protein
MATSNLSNGRLRDECLNVGTLLHLSDVSEKLECWRLDYKQVRPHAALSDRAPEEFVRDWQQLSAASLRLRRQRKRRPAPCFALSRNARTGPKALGVKAIVFDRRQASGRICRTG